MAGMCCGINVGESEPTSPVEPAARTARRRRMELRQQLKFIPDMSECRIKRQKVSPEEARDCQNATDKCLLLTLETNTGTEAQPQSPAREVVEEIPKFGVTSVCGRRRDMEDAVSIRPSFCRKQDDDQLRHNYGCHFYGVFDGHGCSHVAMKCKERMHRIVKEEIESRKGEEEWKETMTQSFTRMDKEVGDRLNTLSTTSCRCELQIPQCDAVGSTAVVAVVTPEKIVVSNCGDSRAVLCRNGVAIPLSSDHKVITSLASAVTSCGKHLNYK